MPFGAHYSPEERTTRLRLWAPAAARVELGLADAAGTLRWHPMAAADAGWFELARDDAGPGTRYCFRADGGLPVPDPASRCQADDVHGPSLVVDPTAFTWSDGDWRGRPWEDAVFYELHVGAFSPGGDYIGVIEHLDHLRRLGVTAIELMPVADFPGARDWGYDGVLPFAPDTRYGPPEDLKRLVQEAHARDLMVFLDVVYNHFGPEGNYLGLYAPQFFTERHHTPWGAAVNFDGEHSHWVRQFFIHNALYWLEEFHLDGLRFDAVHAVFDDRRPDIFEELAAAVHAGPGRERRIHLVLENERNQTRYLGPERYRAQWNDDAHHALHVLTTGEADGYYQDYHEHPTRDLGRCLAEGFAYQGEPSAYRHGERRGEPSGHLPPSAFVNFLQNHDQIGNRACGERIAALAPPEAVCAATAILLLAPSPPLLFMGQEWGTRRPFPFFCDFGADLRRAVVEGRRREFARFSEFQDPARRERIPDPTAAATFASAVLDWAEPQTEEGRRILALHRELLCLRHREVMPRIKGMSGHAGGFETFGRTGLNARWQLADGSILHLQANLGRSLIAGPGRPNGRVLYQTHPAHAGGIVPAWAVTAILDSHGEL